MATKVINTSRSDLSRRFQLNGLQLRADALTLFEAELKHGHPPYQSIEDFISQLSELMLSRMSIDSTIIDAEVANRAIEELREFRRLNVAATTEESGEQQGEFIVIKNVVAYKHLEEGGTGGITSKRPGGQFGQQYNQLVKGLKKLPVFESGQFRLTSIDELNTYDSSIELKCIVFALIRKDPSRIMEFLLEDPTGKVPVAFDRELTNWKEWATFESGVYLAEGSYDAQRDSFLVKSIGLPPPITSMLPSAPEEPRSSPKDSMVIVLSDIHLDKPKTYDALKFLFTGYSQVELVPEVFVLMGDFVSKQVDKFDFKDHMKNLIKLIGTFKRLANQSRFVFVPGPNDLAEECTNQHKHHHSEASESIVVNHFTSDHFPTTTTKLKHYYLASNPFHLQIQGRNLCLYATPLIDRSLKNVVNSPLVDYHHTSASERAPLVNARNISSFLTSVGRTMVSSVHLSAGVNRSYLSSLSLFPRIPEMILFADAEFNQSHQVGLYESAVQFATMGSFSKGGFQFVCYYVDTNMVEESQVSL